MLINFDLLVRRYGVKPQGILHVGANVGEELQAYEKAGIPYVVWVEANKEIYDKLVSNINGKCGHIALNYCIGDQDGQDVTFHVSSNAGQSSSFLDLGTHAKSHPDVTYIKDIPMKTARLDTILKDHDWGLFPMDFLNMDLQGCEGLALLGLGELLHKFKWVYLEVNRGQVYKGNMEVDDIERYLRKFGFYPVVENWTKWQWGDKLWKKR